MRRMTQFEALEFVESFDVGPDAILPAAVLATLADVGMYEVRDGLELFAGQCGFDVDPASYEITPTHLDDAETMAAVEIIIRTEERE